MLGYFDSIVCVNLDKRTDRWAEAREELRLCGLEGCVRISAAYTPEDHVIGCSLSHRGIWHRIASRELGDRTLILEDDFQFITRSILLKAGFSAAADPVRIHESCPGESFAERFDWMRGWIPDRWDLLYLGGSYESPPVGRVNKYIIRNAGMHTTHAYAISRAFAKKMADHLGMAVSLGGGIDSHLVSQSKEPDVFSYTLTPRLFIQRPTSVSDINPQPLGFPWSQTDAAHEMMV
jgi:hypothetical protein